MSLRKSSISAQRGVTLVELLVAVTLMLMVTLATVALYTVNSSSKRTVDASQELDDTARFVFELVGQALRNAGYPNSVPIEEAVGTYSNLFDGCAGTANTEPCPVLGFDDSVVSGSNYGAAGSGAPNASDSLAVRFYGSSQRNASGLMVTDGTVVTCSGRRVQASTVAGELGLSVFWIKMLNGDPELYCTDDDGTGAGRSTDAIARGVESFQVLYGVDACSGTPCVFDGVPDRWVSASDVAATDWRSVKAVRIGLVLRGAPGSSQASDGNDLYPFGKDFVTGYTGAGAVFTPPSDSRLRRVYSTTYLLRNPPA